MEKDLNSIITIQELLKGRNTAFDNSKRIKMVRHKENKATITFYDEDSKGSQYVYQGSLYNMYRYDKHLFLKYQSHQGLDNFKDVEFIVSFIGEMGSESRFVGVYKNCGNKNVDGKTAIFDFQELKEFEILNERVIIDWGESAISWHQWWKNKKEVIRIEKGFDRDNIPPFIRYEDVILSYDQLKAIFSKQNQEWKSKLEACNCIYLILDKSNGKNYVGSMYNKQGIWGRWSIYAETGHGNDISLIELLKNDPLHAQKYFQWSILETLPLNIVDSVAIDRESLYKEKFGTRDFGYNNN
ncbi:MAG: GIY-YIG nuclease family protein [Bacteroidales bacterium]|nr:GIY-YIG nuclease family protein [Bacteroidales bacterium]